MSSDRDRFDDRRDEGAGWHEPAHLGGGEQPPEQPPEQAHGPAPDEQVSAEHTPAEPAPAAWEPPGWSLPPAEPERRTYPADTRPADLPGWYPQPGAGGHPATRREPGEVAKVFRYQGDHVGVQGWAIQHGWTVSDGSGPGDAVLAELIASAPVRATKDHRAAGVLRGRSGPLELVAFDVVYASGRYVVPQWAVTAAPVLVPVPAFRLSPARFWKHRTGGLLQVPSGDPEFDTRWTLLTAEDVPAVHHLAQDRTVRGLLLGSDDGDEFWSPAGHGGGAGDFIAAIRPDGHRPELLEHHARLLAAIVGALTAGA